jgi:phospholipase C
MNENRSLDNLLGWLYPPGTAPAQFIPFGSPTHYDGLVEDTYSNHDLGFDNDNPVYVSNGTTGWIGPRGAILEWFVPSPDPGEEFEHVCTQLFNGGDSADMSGFLADYLSQCTTENAGQIMQMCSTEQLPIISTLARSFAVSDAWFASVPSQT